MYSSPPSAVHSVQDINPQVLWHIAHVDDTCLAIHKGAVPWAQIRAQWAHPPQLLAHVEKLEEVLKSSKPRVLREQMDALTRTVFSHRVLLAMHFEASNYAQPDYALVPVAKIIENMAQNDAEVRSLSCRLACDAIFHTQVADSKHTDILLNFLRTVLDDSRVQNFGMRCLQDLCAVPTVRRLVFQYDDKYWPRKLAEKARDERNPQMQYQCVFVLWLFTFSHIIPNDANIVQTVWIPLFADLLRTNIKEKVLRVLLAALANILEHRVHTQELLMVGYKFPRLVENIKHIVIDAEMVANHSAIETRFGEILAALSTLDEWCGEVRTGRLEWSPVHTAAGFWEGNAFIISQDTALVSGLAKIILNSKSPLTLAVAAFDIGEYTKFYPKGRRVLLNLGVKARLIELMGHEDPKVKLQGLTAFQKFMVNCWDI